MQYLLIPEPKIYNYDGDLTKAWYVKSNQSK
jgi:hypothetical protein